MAINSDIRDQAYQFFIQEAPELLQAIEAGLLTLRQERSTAKVHDLMRAAHSIKGGSAAVGLETIKSLAHHLEDIFKALYSEELEIDTSLESLLLQAYDCLRLPLIEQIAAGSFDSEQALAAADPIFAHIEERLGDAFTNADDRIPSSAELGVDIAKSIFEVDVAQGLERLATVVAHPQDYELAGELRAQAEVFAGFAELLNLPGFGAIAQTALVALNAHPDQALQIAQLALADFQAARLAVLASDCTQGGSPCAALANLAQASNAVREADVFRPFGWGNIKIHSRLADLLLQAYECLRSPLSDQIQKGKYVVASALAKAKPVFAQQKAQLGTDTADCRFMRYSSSRR
jgi:chemotaxis family two-component system sensor histidine kinase/response regulator PixL